MTGFCLAIIRIALSDIRELASRTPSTARELALGPLPLELGVLLGVREQDRVAELAGRLVGAADDLGVERVGDVGDDERERPGVGPRPGRGARSRGSRAPAAAAKIRAAVSELTRPGRAKARETVDAATPAASRHVVDRRPDGPCPPM